MAPTKYIELVPHAKNSFNGERQWRNEAYRTWRCQCSWPKPDVRGPINVVVANPRRNMTVDFIFGFSGFGIVAASLADRLDWRTLSSLFDIGTVSDPLGKPLATFVTLRAKSGPVYIRGGPNSPRRLCPACGRLVLGAFDDRHLCGLDREEVILQSTFGNLLLRSDFYQETVAGTEWKNVKLRHLSVRETASDGLPVNIQEAIQLLKGK